MKFKLTVENNVIEQLPPHKCSILVSMRQTRKFLIFSFNNSEPINQEVLFEAPMGIVVRGQQLAITVISPIFNYVNDLDLAQKHLNKLLSPDILYVPRAVSLTKETAYPNITLYKQRLLGLNLRFTCLPYFYFSYSFILIWQSTFINYFSDDAYLHCNSMAMIDDKPANSIAHGDKNKKFLGEYG